ncbi:glycosyltransferase [Nocardiopsis rhodophaea]|uniref:Glycosyltransferase n=1 Tax=Nocardiopsis rhodophaea TaxID=280238 RepID=A0ABP5EGF2_9ACTN
MPPLDPARHIVTAVIVTHDGDRWLPETLESVREQSRPVQRVVGVDTGSRDDSGRILAEFIAADAITTLARDTGFGDAVRAGLRLPRARAEFPGAAPDATEWIWLIHDDCAPAPDALQHLLLAANDNPRAVVFGPKLRDWYDRRLLVEVGVTIDGAGRRETGLEPREFDHGQHDGIRQVLAVSSAGMLVRRDVWDELDGFDRGLPLFRDDIDFCWRVGGAGHRVLIVTDAVAHHAEGAARRRRTISASGGHPRRIDRRNALFVLLANLPIGGMVGALLRNTIGSLLRVLMYILAKQPANAFDEAAAIASVYLIPGRLIRARFQRRRNRRRTYSAISPFLARGVAMRRLTEMAVNIMTGSPALDTAGRHQAVVAPPPSRVDDDDDPLRDDQSVLRRFITHPGVLLIAALTAVTVVAERSLLFGDHLAGGALAPVTGGAADLWALYLGSMHDVGVGSGAAAPPYVGLLALFSTLTLGNPHVAVTIILLGCVPLAGFTAYQLARRVLRFRPARLWMAGSYALLPMATGAVAQGRLGTALVHALLPVLGILLIQVLTLPGRRSRRAAWALGLFLAVATAFVPLVWLLSLVTGAVVLAAFGHLGRRFSVSVGIALATPMVLLLPWSLELFTTPSMWLLEAGLHRPELSAPPASPAALLMLSPGGPGNPPVWVTGGFIAAALCALLLLRSRMLVAVGWSMALVGILVAILMSRIVVAAPYGSPAAPAWPGVALAFAATAMLLSAATAAQSFDTMWKAGGRSRVFALSVAVLAVTTPLSAAGVWMVEGVEGLDADVPPMIPAVATALSDDGTQPRTLVVAPAGDGPIRYSVLRGREPQIGEEQIPADSEPGAVLDRTVAELSAGRGGDEADTLAGLGIGYVAVPRPEVGSQEDVTVVDTMDGTPGLSRLQLTDDFGLWRVERPGGRLRVVGEGDPVVLATSADEPVSADVPAGEGDRTLVLAEPADGRWSATLDGTELTPLTWDNGMQAFDLPASGGTVEITRGDTLRLSWLLVQGALLVVVVVLALPGARTEEDVRAQAARPAPRPRRPARLRSRSRSSSGGHGSGRGSASGGRRGRRGRGSREKERKTEQKGEAR